MRTAELDLEDFLTDLEDEGLEQSVRGANRTLRRPRWKPGQAEQSSFSRWVEDRKGSPRKDK